MTDNKLLVIIPDILLAQLASFSLVYGLTSSLHLTYPPLKILLLVMLCVTILFISFYNKITSIAATVLLIVVFITSIISIAFGIGMDRVIAFLNEYFYWLGDFMQYTSTPDPLYQLITVIALSIFMSVFFYAVILKRFMFLLIVGAGMGLFVIQWSYNFVSSLVPFYLFLLVALIAYLKHVYALKASKAPNEYVKSGMMVIWSVPVCLIIIVSAFLLHADEKPIEWKWLDKKISSIYNYINKKINYEAFDYFSLSASSGFGDRNNLLGGRVRLDRTNVLSVTTSKRVYLKGATKDIYTGTTWTNKYPEKNLKDADYNAVYSDAAEMRQGIKILTGKDELPEDFFVNNKVNVTFRNLKTKSLFIPSKTTLFTPPKNDFAGFINNTGDLSSEQRLSKGFSYDIDMYSPKIGTEEFANVLRESKKGLYDDYLNALHLKANSLQIYESYLQLPQGLPQRVKDLATSLVASGQNNYDKAKAIEQYLSSNYPYNLDVRSTPRNRDFVDYFLFDLKQGYCSYYATAMTVLARCADLPARYAEGYVLPPEPMKDSTATYLVTNMQAHAWVEIYFEGYGWLAFEPTSPFRSDFYSNESSDVLYASDYNSAYEEYMEMLKRYGNQGDTNTAYYGAAIQDNMSEVFMILITAGITILLFVFWLSFNIVRSRFKLFWLVNLPAKECVLHFYDYYVSVLDKQGFGLMPAETPFQYSARIDSSIIFSPIKFRVITDIFVKSRYSLKAATEKEKQLLCDFHPRFLNEIRANMGSFKYFSSRYLFGKF